MEPAVPLTLSPPSQALTSMSLERGFRHWHGDVDAGDTPDEAGLFFACSKKFRDEEREIEGTQVK